MSTLNVDGVSRYGDSIPTSSHRSIWRHKCFCKSHRFDLMNRIFKAKKEKYSKRGEGRLYLGGGGSDGGLFEDASDALARLDGLLEHLILRLVPCLARKYIQYIIQRIPILL